MSQKSYTQEKLAEVADVSIDQVKKLLNPHWRRRIEKDAIRKISQALELQPTDIVSPTEWFPTSPNIEPKQISPIETIIDEPSSVANLVYNPFIPQNGIVKDPKQFFARKQEIDRIFEILNSGSSVALIGEEGIGKSSLLWAICQQAETRLRSPRQPVFLDLNLVDDEDDLYSTLCNDIGIAESKGNRLTRALKSHRILLALDNVGKLTWEGFTRQIRDRLRGLAEGSDAPLKLILAASEPLDDLFKDSQDGSKTSPLAGICLEEEIKPWNETTIRIFITARLANTSVRFTEAEINQLVQESGGHPRRLMQLCYRTYSQYLKGGQ